MPSSHNPVISVVVPVHDRATLVGEAVKSALEQDVEMEILVVDDGSSDDPGAALEGLNDNRVKLLRHETQRGAAAARNTGIEASRGRYVALLDSDDVWLPGKLAKQLRLLEQAEPGVDATTTGFYIQRQGRGERDLRSPLHCDSVDRLLLLCDLSPGSTLLVRREALERVGPLDESLTRLEDWDWLLRYLREFKLRVVAEPLALVRVGKRPSLDCIEKNTAQLFEKHREWLSSSGNGRLRKFRAGLLVEQAAAAAAEGQQARAVRLLAQSLLLAPRRSRNFYRRVLAKATWN
jgi:glycosyltransferase involved in cell wall biosynthesis